MELNKCQICKKGNKKNSFLAKYGKKKVFISKCDNNKCNAEYIFFIEKLKTRVNYLRTPYLNNEYFSSIYDKRKERFLFKLFNYEKYN